jgi:very-short-patch-repair endonuclease
MSSREKYFPIKEYFPIGGSNLPVRIDHNNSSANGIYNCDDDTVIVYAGSTTTSNEMTSAFKNSSAKMIYDNFILKGSLIKNSNNSDTFVRNVSGKSGLMASLIVRQHVNGADSWKIDSGIIYGHGSTMTLRQFQNHTQFVGSGASSEERKEYLLRRKNIIVGKDEPEFIMLLSRIITEPILVQQVIKGYCVDALVKSLKNVIEYDEKHHFIDDDWSIYTEKDIIRQKIIESAGYNFFRAKKRDWIKDMKNESERFRQHIINIGGKELCVE